MLETLSSLVDPTRDHHVSFALSWHARLMVLGWGVLAPLAILAARFGKIWPGQKWPKTLDNPTWWRLHWMTQSLVIALAVAGLALVLAETVRPTAPLHRILGYFVLMLGGLQYLSGLLRGTKGGPTDNKLGGDHYYMTPRRIWFERFHKSLGYGILLLIIASTLTGIWAANAPVWMPLLLIAFWISLVIVFAVLQRQGRAVDTYQAIWGANPTLPGNQRKPIGWGVTRMDYTGE